MTEIENIIKVLDSGNGIDFDTWDKLLKIKEVFDITKETGWNFHHGVFILQKEDTEKIKSIMLKKMAGDEIFKEQPKCMRCDAPYVPQKDRQFIVKGKIKGIACQECLEVFYWHKFINSKAIKIEKHEIDRCSLCNWRYHEANSHVISARENITLCGVCTRIFLDWKFKKKEAEQVRQTCGRISRSERRRLRKKRDEQILQERENNETNKWIEENNNTFRKAREKGVYAWPDG